jgi:aspartyl-tRNA(Asn)/glutamyl-tRNA(Gln) amidotransferase subunit B
MEEDTGKTTHVGGGGRIHDAGFSLVDYNRAGVPLVEIVSKPDIHSAEHARAYVNELRAILLATGASDAKMEEGSMRVDANVSVNRPGEPWGTRAEIKNLNSVRSLGRAIEYEMRRQIDLLESGERIVQETRHWNEEVGRTNTLRSKEEAMDYRYFPEPDLVPVAPGAEWIGKVRDALPVLPAARRARLAEQTDVAPSDVAVIVDRDLDALVLDALAAGGVAARLLVHAENNLAEGAGSLDAASFASLTKLEADGALTATQAKSVLAELVASGGDPAAIAKAMGFEAMDDSAVEAIVDQLIADNADAFQRFKDGDGKVTGFFVGGVMKATQGKADGKVVTRILQDRASR